MENIIAPTALALADVLKAVHKLEAIDPLGHFVA